MRKVNVAGYDQSEITAEVIGRTLLVEANNEEFGYRVYSTYIGDATPKLKIKNGILYIDLEKPSGKKLMIEMD